MRWERQAAHQHDRWQAAVGTEKSSSQHAGRRTGSGQVGLGWVKTGVSAAKDTLAVAARGAKPWHGADRQEWEEDWGGS